MTPSPPTDPSPIESEAGTPPEHGERKMLVGTLIGVSSFLFLIASGVIYFRWAATNEPNCVIVIEAGTALKGAEITVDNIMLSKPLKVIVGTKDRYSIPFYVDAGEYEIKVRLDGELLFESTTTVSDTARGRMLDLTRLKPATMPTTAGSTM